MIESLHHLKGGNNEMEAIISQGQEVRRTVVFLEFTQELRCTECWRAFPNGAMDGHQLVDLSHTVKAYCPNRIDPKKHKEQSDERATVQWVRRWRRWMCLVCGWHSIVKPDQKLYGANHEGKKK